jgi:predicted nucleotidyltransferase
MTPEDARELARILQRLIVALQPERIHVFGSQARGDVTPDSDTDLLIVVSSADELPHRLDQAAYRAMGPRNLSVDVLVMTREEFDRRARAVASLPATVLREGRLLYAA